jgi:hypothetical protein
MGTAEAGRKSTIRNDKDRMIAQPQKKKKITKLKREK